MRKIHINSGGFSGNLDNFEGETFAPTVSKKVLRLVYAVCILLGRIGRFFYITGAFIPERTMRDLCVFIDVECFKLVFLLCGLDDAAKVFNDGLEITFL